MTGLVPTFHGVNTAVGHSANSASVDRHTTHFVGSAPHVDATRRLLLAPATPYGPSFASISAMVSCADSVQLTVSNVALTFGVLRNALLRRLASELATPPPHPRTTRMPVSLAPLSPTIRLLSISAPVAPLRRKPNIIPPAGLLEDSGT